MTTSCGSRVSAGGAVAVLLLAGVAAVGSQEPGSPSPPPSQSNARMAERLEAEARVAEFNNPNANTTRLEVLLSLTPADSLQPQLLHRLAVAQEMMNAGRYEEPTAELEQLHELLQTSDIDLPGELRDRFLVSVRYALGIAYVRLAQRDNCLRPNPAERCAIPIGEAAVHPNQDSARKAIELYEQLLESDPTDLGLRWLINLLHMWVGEHPTGVAPGALIPRSAFGSGSGFPRFVDVAPQLGLDVVGQAGGSAMEDFDADGDFDLMASSWGLRDQLRFFRNNGDGTFDDATIEAGLEGIVSGLNLVHADYDNDGFADVLVLRGAWHDVPRSNSLLRNNGDGTFTDVAFLAGVGVVGFVKAVVWGDYDNDGRLDLYLSRRGEPNLLFHDDGPSADGRWTFRDVTAIAGVAQPTYSFPAWFLTTTTTAGLTCSCPVATPSRATSRPSISDRVIRRSFPACITTRGTARLPMSPRRQTSMWSSSRWAVTTETWITMASSISTSARAHRAITGSFRTACIATSMANALTR